MTDSRAVVRAIEGAAVIFSEGMLMTLLQLACPEHLSGRGFGLQDSSSAVTQLAGSLIVPVGVGVIGMKTALAIGGGVTVASVAVAPALGHRREAERLAQAQMIEELRAVAMFADLGEGALTRLAEGDTVERHEPGEVVLTEGDSADDLLLV